MSITTITIATVDYVSYASVAEADAYLAVDPTRAATWAALSTDQKGTNLVAATRRLDLLSWEGQKTGSADTQDNSWPRTGATYKDGTAVSTTEVPHGVEAATILLAGSIAITPATSGAGTSGNNIRRLQAGSASLEYFRPTDGKALQDETAFALVKEFLTAGISSDVGAAAYGDGVSSFTDDQMSYGLREGFS